MLVGVIGMVGGLVATAGVLHLVRGATARGALDRQGALGIRTRATLASDRAWVAGHRAAGPWLLAAAVAGYATAALTAVTAVVLAVTGVPVGPLLLVLLAAGFGALVVLVVVAGRRADAAARDPGAPLA